MPSQRDLTTGSVVWYSRMFPIYAAPDPSYSVTRRLAYAPALV